MVAWLRRKPAVYLGLATAAPDYAVAVERADHCPAPPAECAGCDGSGIDNDTAFTCVRCDGRKAPAHGG